MSTAYTEPLLTVAVLDFQKPAETRLCLESIRRHVKVPHKVVYYHNGGSADYPYQLFHEGLVDTLIQTRVNNGLGVGTRDVMAASHSRYTIYHQNDQVFIRDLTETDFEAMTKVLSGSELLPGGSRSTLTISLAGSPCGEGVYSERSYLIETAMYREWEQRGLLGHHGAGPYHNGPWREAQIQAYYRHFGGWHFAWPQPLVMDNGQYAVRDMREAGVWVHRPDTKKCWCVVPPKERNSVYPQFDSDEWDQALSPAGWPDGRIPRRELATSFIHWPEEGDAAYVAALRMRYV